MIHRKVYGKGIASPLQSWDVYAMHRQQFSREYLKKKDYHYLSGLKKHYNWNTNLENILSEDYDALVLTDESVRIQWVNRGFFAMTGYKVKDVLGQTPRLLQGANTTLESRRAVKENLYSGYSFSTTLVNYRKSEEQYTCRVSIYPLYSRDENLSHFIALESEGI